MASLIAKLRKWLGIGKTTIAVTAYLRGSIYPIRQRFESLARAL
jgi:hypothetical protein